MALFTIVWMRLMSRYDARKVIGSTVTSMLVSCCCVALRLSMASVMSKSSKKLTRSDGWFMRVRDMASLLTLSASTPCSESQTNNTQ